MDFLDIANTRQACRSYDPAREIEREKLEKILEAARLAPSACNSQPYLITVCTGEKKELVAETTRGVGMNGFTKDVPVILVISEKPEKKGVLGTLVPIDSYMALDMGIVAAYITAEATTQGLSSCIIGWFDDDTVRKVCGNEGRTRLVIALGYAKEGDPIRKKVRKSIDKLVKEL
ncbi:MAG: nitroreductase family protein [Oscillospiraceae bacterium]|nr:nitroreductase family protein [Oscillospiraceae bacterium]